jgi:choline dehydrogenase-like flavoprotein
MRFFTPTPQMLHDAEIGNCCVRLLPAAKGNTTAMAKAGVKRVLCANEIISDWARSIKFFVCPPPFDEAGLLHVASEQAPNINSRVLLSDEEDRLGLKRVVLDWCLLPIDRRTIRKTVFAVAAYFARTGIGSVKLEDWLHDDEAPVPDVATDPWLGAGWHHMGTTRMAAKPSEGVVDADARVHAIDNLYIAGSSVFATSGHANPTLTIVQLTLRLADHLAKKLKA